MNKQEAYEKIRAYFADESNPFPGYRLDEDGYGHCVYRRELEDGTVARCAAGCLFTDEQYDDWGLDSFEGTTFEFVIVEVKEARKLVGEATSFVGAAQGLHDSFAPRSSMSGQGRDVFLKELDSLAESHGLEVIA